MSSLAPGRSHDIAMLLTRRDTAIKYSADYYTAQTKIDDLVEEGKCTILHGLRYRLLQASIARDEREVEDASRLIEEHVQRKHLKRYYRAWKKG